jgi:hypothetical protein
MATISTAKAKWARKMRNAGEKWKKRVTGKEEAFREGLRRYAEGAPVGDLIVSNWKSGVDAVTPDYFQKAVSGKEEVYARKFLEAIAA